MAGMRLSPTFSPETGAMQGGASPGDDPTTPSGPSGSDAPSEASRELRALLDRRNAAAWDLVLADPQEALKLSEAIVAEAQAGAYPDAEGEAELSIGWCKLYLSRLAEAIQHLERARILFEKTGNALGLSKAFNALGAVHQELGRFDVAMDFYARSLDWARRLGNSIREAVTLSNIGEICLERGDVKEGLDYFLRSYETVMDTDELELVANVLINLGRGFHKMENYVLAREFAEKALGVTQDSGDLMLETNAEIALGRILRDSASPSEAEPHFLKALEVAEKLGSEGVRVSALLELGALDALRGDHEGALERYRNALAGAERLGAKKVLNEAYERLSEVHTALGDYQIALDYYRRCARFEREALGEDTSRKIAGITVQYEVERSRQEAEIYRLRNIELKEKTTELEELNQQLLSISEIGKRVTSSLDLDTVISTLHESIGRHMDASVFGVAVYSEEEGMLDWKAYFELSSRIHRPLRKLDPRRSVAAWCIDHQTSVFMNDTDAEIRGYVEGTPAVVGRPTGSLIFIPLIIEDRVIGLFTVQSFRKNAYTQHHRIFLEALGPYVAIAIENSLIHDRLLEMNRAIVGEKAELERTATFSSHLANHDSLTGLPNRRLLFELLQKSFDIAARNGTKVGIVFIDLDDFKPVNDRFGHLAGDSVLVEIADRLRSSMRTSDTVARVGGDEFIVVLTNIRDSSDITLATGKIIEATARPISLAEGDCSIGLSLGVSVFPDDGTDVEALLGKADTSMYAHKRSKKGPLSSDSEAPQPTDRSRASRRR